MKNIVAINSIWEFDPCASIVISLFARLNFEERDLQRYLYDELLLLGWFRVSGHDDSSQLNVLHRLVSAISNLFKYETEFQPRSFGHHESFELQAHDAAGVLDEMRGRFGLCLPEYCFYCNEFYKITNKVGNVREISIYKIVQIWSISSAKMFAISIL